MDLFGRSEAYQLIPGTPDNETVPHLRGRFLFDTHAHYNALNIQLTTGAAIKTTTLSEQFDYDAFQMYYHHRAMPLFVITSSGDLMVWTTDQPLSPVPGQRVVSLIPADVLAAVSSDMVPDSV